MPLAARRCDALTHEWWQAYVRAALVPHSEGSRGAAAEAEVNVDEGTGEDDAAWAAGEGDGLGGREGA